MGLGSDGGDKISHLVGEQVLVAKTVPRGPPVFHVWMFRFGDHDAVETGCAVAVMRVVELQEVHVLKIERQGAA